MALYEAADSCKPLSFACSDHFHLFRTNKRRLISKIGATGREFDMRQSAGDCFLQVHGKSWLSLTRLEVRALTTRNYISLSRSEDSSPADKNDLYGLAVSIEGLGEYGVPRYIPRLTRLTQRCAAQGHQKSPAPVAAAGSPVAANSVQSASTRSARPLTAPEPQHLLGKVATVAQPPS